MTPQPTYNNYGEEYDEDNDDDNDVIIFSLLRYKWVNQDVDSDKLA